MDKFIEEEKENNVVYFIMDYLMEKKKYLMYFIIVYFFTGREFLLYAFFACCLCVCFFVGVVCCFVFFLSFFWIMFCCEWLLLVFLFFACSFSLRCVFVLIFSFVFFVNIDLMFRWWDRIFLGIRLDLWRWGLSIQLRYRDQGLAIMSVSCLRHYCQYTETFLPIPWDICQKKSLSELQKWTISWDFCCGCSPELGCNIGNSWDFFRRYLVWFSFGLTAPWYFLLTRSGNEIWPNIQHTQLTWFLLQFETLLER